ncbi:MAG: hypothetical protein Ta2B_18740 [Termitinemataceae bacterium]|nr:MAG: hypothetical protein Ta2B_18740 [Termitinemataceae bacterium]
MIDISFLHASVLIGTASLCLRAPLNTRGTQDRYGFRLRLKPKSAVKCPHIAGKRPSKVLWRAFLAKTCGERRCEIAEHEFLEVPLSVEYKWALHFPFRLEEKFTVAKRKIVGQLKTPILFLEMPK